MVVLSGAFLSGEDVANLKVGLPLLTVGLTGQLGPQGMVFAVLSRCAGMLAILLAFIWRTGR